MKTLPRSVLIVGAGPSGIFMAKRLKKIAEAQGREIDIHIIERNPWIGGKCHTFVDPNNPDLRSEFGAGAIAPNYGIVLDEIREHGVALEYMVDTNMQGLHLLAEFRNSPWYKKPGLIKEVLGELRHFNRAYATYKTCKDDKSALPEELSLPFRTYCEQQELVHLPDVLRFLVPGFGYGSLDVCPVFSVLEYMGRTTLFDMIAAEPVLHHPPLMAIHGGFQHLMEIIATDLQVNHGVEFTLSADILRIDREEGGVTVSYEHEGEEIERTYDSLVLANSPLHWPELNMTLTELEQQCVDVVRDGNYYRYPVGICRIRGLPSEQYFFPEALETEGFGHVALITSRDAREEPPEGRLCTIYVNLEPGDNAYSLAANWETIQADLLRIEGVEDVEFVEEKIWEDYNSFLPWDTRLALDAAQYTDETKTMYTGSYVLGGFEDVLCVANAATHLANEMFTPRAPWHQMGEGSTSSRVGTFFGSAYPPVNEEGFGEPSKKGCARCTIL